MYPRDLPALASTAPVSLVTSASSPPYAQPGLSLAQIASILWAYRTWSLLIAVTVILAAAALCAVWPRTYEASASLMVNFEVNDPLAGREFPTGLLGSYMATQVELARSTEVLQPVIEKLGLERKKNYRAGYSGDADGLRNWIEIGLRKKLLVEQGRYGSQLISVTYSARSPDEAAQVANTVADVFSERQYQRLAGPASERAQRYTAQLAELKSKVVRAQEQVTDYRSQNGLTDSDARFDVDMHATLIQTLKAQFATQSTRLAELRPTFGAQHPQVLELQSQIGATRQALETELRGFSNKADAERVGAKYQLEMESAQAVYARALDGYDQIMFASTGGYSNIEIVSRATPPPRPSKPKVTLLLILAALAGGALGIAIPLVYELLNRRVRSREDVERDHGILVLVELGPIGTGYPMARGAA